MYFYHKLTNYTFHFIGKELFIEDNNKRNIYFLICLKNNAADQWIFGKVFMKKYQIIFNSQMKTIGFYTNSKNQNSINDIFQVNNKQIFIIITFLIILILLILLISILLWNKNKIIMKFYNKNLVKELEMINKNDNFI